MKSIALNPGRRKLSFAITIFLILISLLAVRPLFACERIVAIGDSITRGDIFFAGPGGRNTIQGGWAARLGARLDQEFPKQYEVLNMGINGDNALGVLNRLESDLISKRPDIIIIAVGTNDVYGSSASAPPSITVESYGAAMAQIFDKIKGKMPDTPVFVMGLSIPLKKYLDQTRFKFSFSSYTQEIFDSQFNAYNAVLKDLTESRGYYYLDIASIFSTISKESGRPGSEEFYADGVHPNDAGYEAISKYIYRALRAGR